MNPTRKQEPSQLRMSVSTRSSEDEGGQVRTAVPEESASAESLDTVRDILFGAQSREYESRFARLEERLLQEAEDLRNDLRSRCDSLEMYIKKEVESLTGRIAQEQKEKSESLRALSQELNVLGKQIQDRIDRLDGQTTHGHHELQQQVRDQRTALSEDIQQKHAELSGLLDKAMKELRAEKLDRVALAEMFMESALRLNQAFKLPEKDES
ncbi:MAG: hypothetical protein MRJ96_09185 [Nitrospirales bacterium]|nr:hypothetical protein [Nitrospira sp.]MDR4501606.1 hypothetical protein [Nitrospirales bacterium]